MTDNAQPNTVDAQPAGSPHRDALADEEPTLGQVFATLRRRELYGNLLTHLFVFIPAAVVIGLLARRLDRTWGWAPIAEPPINVVVALLCFGAGGFVVWYCYGYLYLKGRGSPGSHLGYTRKLVDTGIYSWIRHPSVLGKLIGVIGLAVLMRSPSFLVVFIPILLLYSYITNMAIQERYCLKNFGQQYETYRNKVPMLIPRWSRLMQHLARRKEQRLARRKERRP